MTTWSDLFKPGEATNFFDPPPPQQFHAGSTAFDGVNAWWLAELSRLVYRDNDDRKQFLARASLEELDFINAAHNTQGFLVSPASREWAALVFRGTSNLEDFLIDGDFRLFQWDRGRVHHGFKLGIDAAWPQVLKDLGTLPGSCHLYFAGHSLGAALATLAASRKRPAATYTFGSPLVGDQTFIQTVDAAHTFRVIDHNDLVTHVPPAIPLVFPYTHVGEEHRLAHTADESVQVLHLLPHLSRPGIDEMQRTLPGPPDPLADHAPINYVDRLGATIGFPPRTRHG